jgi:hypothetical protein
VERPSPLAVGTPSGHEASNSQDHSTIANIITHLRSKGVTLWCEEGKLKYRAVNRAITEHEFAWLRGSRESIIALLQSVDRFKQASSLGQSLYRAPLAFSQQAHWNLYRLGERPSRCVLSAILSVHGPLNLAAVRESLSAITRRHSALRTRLVVCDGTPMQEIYSPGNWTPQIYDMTELPKGRQEIEVLSKLEALVRKPIRVTADALFDFRLIKTADDEHILVALMEHSISDGYSVGVLLREFPEAYRQSVQEGAISLTKLPIQLTDVADWQRSSCESFERHRAYWTKHFEGCGRVEFPHDRTGSGKDAAGWRITQFTINKPLKMELLEWSRQSRTTMVMSVFTAYVGLVFRWCNVPDTVVLFQSDGRAFHNIPAAVGYFAFPLYLRLRLREADTFTDLMKLVTEEYCSAHEHADFSHLESQVPRPDFTRNGCFNWLPKGMEGERSEVRGTDGAVVFTPIDFQLRQLPNFERDTEPMVGFMEKGDEIIGDISFPLDRFSPDLMESFTRNLMKFLTTLVRHPDTRVKDILLS